MDCKMGQKKKFWSESKIVTVNSSIYNLGIGSILVKQLATQPRVCVRTDDGRRTLLGCIFIDMRWKLTKKSEQLTW